MCAEASYENPGQQSAMGLIDLGGEIQGSENTPPWMDQKRSSFPSLTGTDNTNWDTVAICMSMVEDAIRKPTDSFNTPVDFWGCTNYPKYYADRFHTYRNCPNKWDLDVAERSN